MREQARFLEHIAAGASVRRKEPSARIVLPGFAADRDVALCGPREPGYAAQQRRLSRARRTEERGDAARGRVQISLNLAYGSAMASIGLTIPALAVASIWLEPPLELGLGPTELVLLAITFVTGALTAPLGQATVQQTGVRIVLFAAFLVLAVFP